jgi:hypothetical protein
MQRKITHAATVSGSFCQASELLDRLADRVVSARQVERLAHRIGAERVAERDAAVAAFQALPLARKFAVPAGVVPPDLAVVEGDGGRLQIREPASRPDAPTDAGGVVAGGPGPTAPAPATAEPPPAAAPPETGAGQGWEEEKRSAGHGREDRIGLLLTMHSAVSLTDPCPEIPPSFLDVVRIPELAREISRQPKQAGGPAAAAPAAEPAEGMPPEPRDEPPEVQKRQVVASRRPWRAFAPMLAAAAWALGLPGAARKALVADGAASNWTLWRRFFGSFVPILDFIHALSYVFAAALAGRPFAAGWACYRPWIAWVWRGQVARVIAALAERQAELGEPEEGEPETSPRQVAASTLRYLGNHQDKMCYDEYRRQGLPLTSSLMESVVEEVGRRVKGTEKFWSEDGAEALLQVRADYLSDDEPLDGFWQRRQERATGQRRYRRAG